MLRRRLTRRSASAFLFLTALLAALASPASAQFEPVGQGPSVNGNPPGPGNYYTDRDAGISADNATARRANVGLGTFTRLGKVQNQRGALFHFDTALIRGQIATALAPFGVTPEQARDAGALRVSFRPYFADGGNDPTAPITVEAFLTANDWAEGDGTDVFMPDYTGPAASYNFARDNPDANAVVPWANPDGTTVNDVDDLAVRATNTGATFTVTPSDAYTALPLDTDVWYLLLYGNDGAGTFAGNLRSFGLPSNGDNGASFRQRHQSGGSQGPRCSSS
jgi:hypothetical protein